MPVNADFSHLQLFEPATSFKLTPKCLELEAIDGDRLNADDQHVARK